MDQGSDSTTHQTFQTFQGQQINSTTYIGCEIYNRSQDTNTLDRFGTNDAEQKLKECMKKKVQEDSEMRMYEPVRLRVVEFPCREGEVLNSCERDMRGKLIVGEGHTNFNDIKHIFEQARKRALAEKTVRPSSQNNFPQSGNIVGIIGEAGMGKTTLEKNLVEQITKTGDDQPYVFFVPLRKIDFSQPISVLEFLLKATTSDWNHEQAEDEALLKKIHESPNVFVVIDDLDEVVDVNFSTQAKCMNLYESKTPDVITKNLLSGHLFPRAKILIASRPGAFHDLHPKYEPPFTVKVLGLDETSRKVLCQNVCRDGAEKVESLLQSNPSIAVFCSNPMYCTMVMKYLLQLETDDSPLLSITHLFTSTFERCFRSQHFREQNKGEESLHRLAKLALTGIIEGKFEFESENIREADLKSLETFVEEKLVKRNDKCERVLQSDKRFCFSHRLWQEYFAALHLMCFTSYQDFDLKFDELMNSKKWNEVIKFMFGFFRPAVQDMLKAIFPDCMKSFTKKKSKLLTLINHMTNRGKEQLLDQLKLCSWASEANDDCVTKLLLKWLPTTIELTDWIHPNEIEGLCHVMHAYQTHMRIFVGARFYATFHGNALNMLLEAVNSSPNHQLVEFAVSGTNIGKKEAVELCKQTSNLNVLRFLDCDITDDAVKVLCNALQESSKGIKELNIGSCPLGSSLVKQLLICVGCVERLTITNCNVDDNGADNLAKTMTRTTKVKVLDLRKNKMTPDGKQRIQKAISENETGTALVIAHRSVEKGEQQSCTVVNGNRCSNDW